MEIRWRGRGRDLNASPPNPGDWPILITPQILTQSSNSDDHLCASNASTQSDHNRSKEIGAFHATLIGTRTKQQQELLRKLNSRVCLKSFRTRTTRAGGNGPLCQVEHVHISSNGTQSGIKVKVETWWCIVVFHRFYNDIFYIDYLRYNACKLWIFNFVDKTPLTWCHNSFLSDVWIMKISESFEDLCSGVHLGQDSGCVVRLDL